MLTFLLTMGIAFGQDVGDKQFVTTEVKLLRYADAVEISATVKKGGRVEVVAVGDNLVRVRSGRDFGWVHPDLLSADAPEGM